jgi:type II restriction enzyme
LLQSIKKGKGISFPLGEGEALLSLLDIAQLKKGAGLKSDIYIDVSDPLTGATGMQGYTIKALIGSKPTLFNASEPTNLTYRIDPPLLQTDVDECNRTDAKGKLVNGVRDTVANIMSSGHTMTLAQMDNRFKANLELLDSSMPSFISELVLTYYSRKLGKKSSIKDTVEYLSVSNPLGVGNPNLWYLHKIKDFLEASAYGMVPTEPYKGERTAAGGLLLVERNGGLACFRLDDKDKTRDYLTEHTYFETASRRKHNFGIVENIDGETRLKLNLQIRYK